jgi:GMP synthase-like glutamine amidotransferase
MRIHYLQHAPFEGPAYIAEVAKKSGAASSHTHLYDGQSLPEPSAFDLLVILGGPMGVYDDREFPWLGPEKKLIERALASAKKIIGICLGAQLLAHVLGARVRRNLHPEIGWFPVSRGNTADSVKIGKALPHTFNAFHWHYDVFDIPHGAVHLAASAATENQAYIYEERALGLQFHLESSAESIRQIYDNCGDANGSGIYIQKKEDALKMNNIEKCNFLFETLDNEFI